jgi:ATP-dependent Lhr-like helicase
VPVAFRDWFARRGWRLREHQAAMMDAAAAERDALLIAPTGGGKTLGGFLPSLVELAAPGAGPGLHTVYISPLKALTNDIARNLAVPVSEMGLPIRYEVRTGDTPQNRRKRQLRDPPQMLLTTPESLALLLSYAEAPALFGCVRRVVLDELHALAESKRGALLSLGLARLRGLAPGATFAGLSATVADPAALLRYLTPDPERAVLVEGPPGAEPDVRLLIPEHPMPWGGTVGLYAAEDLYRLIEGARLTLVFVNTRARAELIFGALWRLNRENLPIGLHHGSLDVEQRRKVEAAMARGVLRAVVATSSLDLGIDWGDVDLVVQVGAPKGAARLLQRIGRANHRLDEPSRAVMIPGNRFEVLECMAAEDALAQHTLDGGLIFPGGLDVLAQHITGVACAGPFDAGELYDEVRSAAPFAGLTRKELDDTVEFVATGGYALRTYDRYRRLEQGEDGRWRLADKEMLRRYRMNIGTIVEAPLVRIRLGRKRLGEVEEMFIASLAQGDTFLFAGQLLRFESIRDGEAIVTLAKERGDPKVPTYAGARLPLSTHLADRVRALIADRERWAGLPEAVREWLQAQERRAAVPAADELLVETFARAGRHYLVAYCFAGRNAQQTLGMLLTRRMERRGLRPQGFSATDYCLAVWSLRPVEDVPNLFSVDILGDELEEWMAESSLVRRTFRNCAVVAGLIERRIPGQEKTGRQVTFSSDLIYDVLRKYEPDHVLLRAARAEATFGMTDIRRLADFLVGVQGHTRHARLRRISPFAIAIIAGIGKEFVADDALDDSLDELVQELVAEAFGEPEPASI